MPFPCNAVEQALFWQWARAVTLNEGPEMARSPLAGHGLVVVLCFLPGPPYSSAPSAMCLLNLNRVKGCRRSLVASSNSRFLVTPKVVLIARGVEVSCARVAGNPPPKQQLAEGVPRRTGVANVHYSISSPDHAPGRDRHTRKENSSQSRMDYSTGPWGCQE